MDFQCNSPIKLPPVRVGSKPATGCSKKQSKFKHERLNAPSSATAENNSAVQSSQPKQRISSSDYRAWDKLDVVCTSIYFFSKMRAMLVLITETDY